MYIKWQNVIPSMDIIVIGDFSILQGAVEWVRGVLLRKIGSNIFSQSFYLWIERLCPPLRSPPGLSGCKTSVMNASFACCWRLCHHPHFVCRWHVCFGWQAVSLLPSSLWCRSWEAKQTTCLCEHQHCVPSCLVSVSELPCLSAYPFCLLSLQLLKQKFRSPLVRCLNCSSVSLLKPAVGQI